MAVVRVLLVRHGHAGTKEGWADDDRLRPLDARGRRQARRLAAALAPTAPPRLVSSPYLRCVETLEPLSAEIGVRIERHEALTPDSAGRALDLVRELASSASGDGIVVCTHGEVLGDVLERLASEDGLRLGRRPPGPKGCIWVIECERGGALRATYLAPHR